MKKVVIVQRRLTHYRVPLFEALRDALAVRDIRLQLLVGHGTSEEDKKRDLGELAWASPLPTYYFAGGRLCWQPFNRQLIDAELVIVTQENKLILNHILLLAPRRFRLAFWGHGGNLQSNNANGLRERYKRWTTNRVDWWFAYTHRSRDLVTASGFPAERITVLNNAVDTSELLRHQESIHAAEILSLRQELGLGDEPAGVFVGSLYPDKGLDFLFAAAEAIRNDVGTFHLLIIGDGPERNKVQAWCDARPWARWLGARFGREKIAYVCMAQVMLNPGALGLGIMDAFVCRVPVITTDCGKHGPEIAYLENGQNGLMTANNVGVYAASVVRLLRDPEMLDVLRTGCATSVAEYTVEKMARRFTDGIEFAITV